MQITFRLPVIFLIVFIAGRSFANPKISFYRDSVKKQNTATILTASQERKYITGSRGGCYYINKKGNKTYVDRSFCNDSSFPPNKIKADVSPTAPASRNYIRGSRGGCYYVNKSGKKVYVGREMCE